ncbi:MAG: hydroxyacid dehydrogenase [Spirochaetales bacterium]|nr:hydroxyacid dehydrogenase [Spirochaetales bacterium]
MLILISDAFDSGLSDKLIDFGEVTDDKSRLAEAEVVLIRSKTQCNKDYIDNAKNLKLIIRGGVGIDNIDKEYAESKGIVVRNTPKASSIAVAELAFAHMISVPNRIVEGHTSMASGKWIKKELKRTELYGKTLCLVGLGNISKEVAKRASAFGMEVVAYDKYVKSSDLAELKNTLKEAVQHADYISMHLPLTPETEGIMNEDIINCFKKNPVIINTGRGACINADDMKAALEDGRVSAYAADVWPSDPPSDDYPILSAKNVLMTPHLGASSAENLLRIGSEAHSIIEEIVKEGKI